MIVAAWAVLVGCLLVLGWTYLGYPVWLLALARLKPRSVTPRHWQPHVTVCMAVHNGMAHLDAKIDGLLAHDYPADRLDLVVVSDGSTDGTGARLRERAGDRLVAVDAAVRRGKTACLAEAIARARGDVLLFTDVRQRLAPGSVQALCDALASGELAAVSGQLRLEDAGGYAQAVDAYWKYETAIRRAEAASGSVVGVSGALYAVRRQDMPVPPPGLVLDDVWVPMRIAANGGRIGLEPTAVAFDRASASAAVESGRKRRTLSGNWQLLARWSAIAIPGRHPLAWRFIHHKLLRLVAPLFLLGAFVANAALLGQGTLAIALFAAQCAAYALALAGFQWPALRALLPVKLASAFLEMNAYAVLGFIDFLRSRDAHLWAAAPSVIPPSPP
ncbi:glycosyltransferase family 2 protein [Silanimonas sp.]|uniref:glycosyltransferase family 2 protein n=1 Tax=Silanimonas sp. TaxID=1929290 RepID=UPI0037C74217